MPSFDGGIVDYELVLGLVLRLGGNLDCSSNERERMIDLLDVVVTFHFSRLDFSLLD